MKAVAYLLIALALILIIVSIDNNHLSILTIIALVGMTTYKYIASEHTSPKTGGVSKKQMQEIPKQSDTLHREDTNFIVLPHQLFEDIELLSTYDNIFIVEDPVYFTRLPFHKLKLVFHRATLKYYYDYVRERVKGKVNYVEYRDADKVYSQLTNATLYDPVDNFMRTKLNSVKNIRYIETPYFLTPMKDLTEYKKTVKSYRHDTSFYRWQRRRLNVLMQGKKPMNDKWTYDHENRNPFPIDQEEPTEFVPSNNKYVEEARQYVKTQFNTNYGDFSEMIYPITHEDAKKHLKLFIKERFKLFGKYQDGAHEKITFGYHSVLSSSINCGLITPEKVLNVILEVKGVPLSSKEGFIRQLIGWREYCRLIYEFEGEKMRKSNYFNAQGKLNTNWWEGTTGLAPIDIIVKRVNKYSYAHHIERLMYLANVMLMCQIEPTEVYNWFIGFVSIDAYDWVMVPNIYGMGTYADGGIMMTRPYFSSSAYIKKMSNLIKTDEDADIFDCLYYNFIGTNKAKLRKNYYTARSIGHYDRKTEKEKKHYKEIAQKFIDANTTSVE